MRRLLCVLAVTVLATVACSGAATDDGEAEPTTSPLPTTEPETPATPTPTSTPTPTPTPQALAPLTGVPLDDEDALDRPVLALKIDNAFGARPPIGLDEADVVLEELVEGGLTRFIALFSSGAPDIVGPVRSGREVDAVLLPAFSPVLGISGAAASVHGELRAAGLLVFEEGQGDGAFVRDTARRAPHNLMVRPDRLWAAGGEQPPAALPWPIAARQPDGGETANGVALQFSHAASSSWEWDGQQWLRSQDGAEHVTADQDRMTAANVVVATVDVARGSRTDSAGSPTVDMRVTGEGDLLVLRDGRLYEGRWRKDGADSQFEWLAADGEPLPLAPGVTWVELLPTGGQVTVDTLDTSTER